MSRGPVDSVRGRPVEGPGVSGGGFPVGPGNSSQQGCFESALEVLLGGFWECFGALGGAFLASCLDPFLAQEIQRFLGHLWWSFCMVSEGPEARKWSSRVHETLIFAKSPVSLRGRFSMKMKLKKGPKMVPKWLAKSLNKSANFFVEKSCVY